MSQHPDAERQAQLWDRWAEQLPDLYDDRDPMPAVDFLSSRFPTGSGALELGAGSGRVTVPLAARGFQVTALEVSPLLADRLRARATDGVTVVEGDMASFHLGRFSFVYCVHSSFFQVTEQSRQVECMRRVREHLTAGGSFVLSCYVPDRDLLAKDRNLTLSAISGSSVEIRATEVQYNSQKIAYRELTFAEGQVRVLPVEQRFCWPSELDLMAQLAGLRLRARFEDYSGKAFTEDSRRHVSIYERA